MTLSGDTHQYGFLLRTAAADWLQAPRHQAEIFAMIKTILVPVSGSAERSGPARTQFIHAAMELGADLLVVGAFGHGQFREEVLGGVTQSLLESANLPILMMH